MAVTLISLSLPQPLPPFFLTSTPYLLPTSGFVHIVHHVLDNGVPVPWPWRGRFRSLFSSTTTSAPPSHGHRLSFSLWDPSALPILCWNFSGVSFLLSYSLRLPCILCCFLEFLHDTVVHTVEASWKDSFNSVYSLNNYWRETLCEASNLLLTGSPCVACPLLPFNMYLSPPGFSLSKC